MSVDIKVTGLHEVQEKMRTLEKKTVNKDMKLALNAGAQVIADEGNAIAPERTGTMAGCVVVRSSKSRRGVRGVKVTYNKKKYPAAKGFYGAFADLGHFTGQRVAKSAFKAASETVAWSDDKNHRHSQNLALYAALSRAKGRTRVEGSHTLATAFATKKEEAVEAFMEKLKELVES